MPRRNFLAPTLCMVLLVAIWTWRYPPAIALDSQWQPSLGNWSPTPGGDRGSERAEAADQPAAAAPTIAPSIPPTVKAETAPPKGASDVDLSDPDAPFIGWPLQRLCEESTYVPGLVFVCDNNSGGIGNIRNYIQTCIRYAFEAGASSLVVPKIRKRNDKDLADLFMDFHNLTYMFDEAHFKSVFKDYCPQITLYDTVEDIPNVPMGLSGSPLIEEIVPKDFGNREGCDWKDQNRHTSRFGLRFREYLQDSNHGIPPSQETPRLIRFKWGILFDWQTYMDGPELWATFGSILKLNAEFLKLGKTALRNMQSFAVSKGIQSGDFIGLHLRTESDAMDFWPRYAVQAGAHIQKAKQHGFKVGYLATGDATEAAKFAKEALAEAQMTVVTKFDLLTGEDLEKLKSLSWDQQGLVDHVVLLGSTFFSGVMPSSFSVYTAMKRHLKTGGLYTRPYKAGTEGDGLSYIVGRYEKYWDDWVWLWDGMWP